MTGRIRRSSQSEYQMGCLQSRLVSHTDRFGSCRMAELNAHFPGRRVVSGGRLAQNGLPSDNARPVQTAKRKASAEFTPSAPNGLPLRHVKSPALLGRQDKTRRLDKVEDVEDSPRIKRMRVDRSAAANERNGGEAVANARRFPAMRADMLQRLLYRPSQNGERIWGGDCACKWDQEYRIDHQETVVGRSRYPPEHSRRSCSGCSTKNRFRHKTLGSSGRPARSKHRHIDAQGYAIFAKP